MVRGVGICIKGGEGRVKGVVNWGGVMGGGAKSAAVEKGKLGGTPTCEGGGETEV